MKKYLSYYSIDAEMEDLREFYDPDTVDLMQWIQQNTQQVRPQGTSYMDLVYTVL
jgi:hypothetical protein